MRKTGGNVNCVTPIRSYAVGGFGWVGRASSLSDRTPKTGWKPVPPSQVRNSYPMTDKRFCRTSVTLPQHSALLFPLIRPQSAGKCLKYLLSSFRVRFSKDFVAVQPEKSTIRIVAGTLRGRRITAVVNDELRPTPSASASRFSVSSGTRSPVAPLSMSSPGPGSSASNPSVAERSSPRSSKKTPNRRPTSSDICAISTLSMRASCCAPMSTGGPNAGSRPSANPAICPCRAL